MKNKKAFTLIEMIGIITILALIMLIALPSMTKTLKRNEQKKYDNYINNLKLVSETYLADQLQKGQAAFGNGNDTVYFTLGDIIDAGYVKDVIKNPNTDKNLSRSTIIKAVKNLDSTYSFEIVYSNIEDYSLKDSNNNIVKPAFHIDSIAKEENYINVDSTYLDDSGYKDFKDSIKLYKNGSQELFYDFISEMKDTNFSNLSISFNYKANENNEFEFNFFNNNHVVYNDFGITNTITGQGVQKIVINNNGVVKTISDGPIENQNNTVTLVFNENKSVDLYINGIKKVNYTSFITDDQEDNMIFLSCVYDSKITGPNNFVVYKKALSAQEVQNLYNLDKERFGE